MPGDFVTAQGIVNTGTIDGEGVAVVIFFLALCICPKTV
jgi:hypothetical protein